MATKTAPFSFGTNHPVFGSQMQKPVVPAGGMAPPIAPVVSGMAPPVHPPVLTIPPAQMFPGAAAQPQPAPPQGMPPANAPGGGGIDEFLKNIIGPFLQQQGQMQQQQNQAQNAFRQDATFGRHLGMDGQPIATTPQTPLSFDQLRAPMAQRIAAEQGTFGSSYTGGDRSMPTAQAMQATQPPPQTMGQLNPWMPQQYGGAPSVGSPVYRQQNPGYRMF